MTFIFESKEEFEARRGSDFTLLPEDDYIVEVKEIEVKHNVTNKFRPDDPPGDRWTVKLRAISFSNGDELVDVDGNPPDGERLFFSFLDPARRGLVPRPSKTRKFLAAALGMNVEDRIELESLDDLIGKRLNATIIHKNGYANPDDFRPIRKRAVRKAADEDVKQAADEKLAPESTSPVAAEEIFASGDDVPF